MAQQKSWFQQEQRWKNPEKTRSQCQQERKSEQTMSQKRTTEKKKLGWRFPRVPFRTGSYS